MNNEFLDEGTGLTFLIPFSRQLQTWEAEIICKEVIKGKKAALLAQWKKSPKNKNWEGDKDAKKEELFEKVITDNNPIFVFGHSIEEILQGDLPPNE